MSQNSSEVAVGATGAIYSFPVNTVLQWGAHAALPVAVVEHGFASEDGVTITGSRTNTNIMAWQGATVVRTVVTESSVTYSFSLLQSNADNMELFYGVKKNAVTGAYHWDAGESGGRKSFIVDVLDKGADKKFRYYIPSGEVTEVGDINIVSGDAISYEVTITAYKVDVEDQAANTLIWDDTYLEDVTP